MDCLVSSVLGVGKGGVGMGVFLGARGIVHLWVMQGVTGPPGNTGSMEEKT